MVQIHVPVSPVYKQELLATISRLAPFAEEMINEASVLQDQAGNALGQEEPLAALKIYEEAFDILHAGHRYTDNTTTIRHGKYAGKLAIYPSFELSFELVINPVARSQ